MLAVTLHVPVGLADAVTELLQDDPIAFNVTRLRGVCLEPAADVISCTVPREWVPRLLLALADIGFDEEVGTITLDERVIVLGHVAERAAREAKGAPDDALVWSALRASTSVATEMSFSYITFMVLATLLAGIGLITSSSVLVVGGMILSPEFGALAHLCVSSVAYDGRGILVSLVQLVTGFTAAIGATALIIWMLHASTALDIQDLGHAFEASIVSPSTAGFVVALISGMAGVLTLTSAKGEALIGVLVSVTTIPAAADISVGIADGDAGRIANGAATLGLNLAGLVLAGAATLAIFRWITRRRDAQLRPPAVAA